MKYLLVLLILTSCECECTEVTELRNELQQSKEYIQHLEQEVSILESYLCETL